MGNTMAMCRGWLVQIMAALHALVLRLNRVFSVDAIIHMGTALCAGIEGLQS